MEINKLTQKEVHEFFTYDEKTGKLYWKPVHSWKNRHIINSNNSNKEAGTIAGERKKYLQVRLKNKKYYVHKIIWLYYYGYYSENQIDHINKNSFDNRIENLREVSQQCNSRNSKISCNNKSTINGVSWDKTHCTWKIYIGLNGKNCHLGSTKDLYEAACLRLASEQCLGWSGCDSNSSAYQFVKKYICKKT